MNAKGIGNLTTPRHNFVVVRVGGEICLQFRRRSSGDGRSHAGALGLDADVRGGGNAGARAEPGRCCLAERSLCRRDTSSGPNHGDARLFRASGAADAVLYGADGSRDSAAMAEVLSEMGVEFPPVLLKISLVLSSALLNV